MTSRAIQVVVDKREISAIPFRTKRDKEKAIQQGIQKALDALGPEINPWNCLFENETTTIIKNKNRIQKHVTRKLFVDVAT